MERSGSSIKESTAGEIIPQSSVLGLPTLSDHPRSGPDDMPNTTPDRLLSNNCSARRKLFGSPTRKVQRGPRSIESVRARRRRYKQKKSKCKKEAWEAQLETDLCKRWRERRENFENEQKKDQLHSKVREETANSHRKEQEVYNELEANCRQEILQCQEEVYYKTSEESKKSQNAPLLLPSVCIQEASNSDLPQLNVTGIDRVAIGSCIQSAKEETRKAQREALCYRNMAERLRKEKRELETSLSEKVELVRDFWRNSIKEGSTRAGKMVQKALLTSCQYTHDSAL